MTRNDLIKKAKEASNNAYAPYSGYHVGAAVETLDGTIYLGSNVENVSYSLTVCAERVAIFKAVSEGKKSFKAVAIYASEDKMPYPCGACLQVFSEFNEDFEIYISNITDEVKVLKKSSLLTHPFTSTKTKKHDLKD